MKKRERLRLNKKMQALPFWRIIKIDVISGKAAPALEMPLKMPCESALIFRDKPCILTRENEVLPLKEYIEHESMGN